MSDSAMHVWEVLLNGDRVKDNYASTSKCKGWQFDTILHILKVWRVVQENLYTDQV